MAWIDGIDDRKMACKFHRQFAHPHPKTLKRIIQNAGVQNKKIEKEIDLLAEKCLICLKFQKRPPRPIATVPGLIASGPVIVYMNVDRRKRKWAWRCCCCSGPT